MACADVDLDIYADAQEAGGAEREEAPEIWCYRASMMIPEKRRPLHNLLQKQPAAFVVRASDTLTNPNPCCLLLPQSQNPQRWEHRHTCTDLSACVACHGVNKNKATIVKTILFTLSVTL